MYEFRLPDVGEGLHEAEIGHWLVAEGEYVQQDQPLLEIETDKATVELPSPVAGTIVRLAVASGEIAQVGDLLVVIDPADRPAAQAASTTAQERKGPQIGVRGPGERILASPVARKMAAELGVDLRAVKGSGPAGRIMTADVEAAAKGASPALVAPAAEKTPARVLAAPAVRKLAAEAGVDLAQVPGSGDGGRVTLPDLQRYLERSLATTSPEPPPVEPAAPMAREREPVPIPLRGVRRTIARRMEEAWRIPQVTSFDEFDAEGLVAVRAALRPLAEAKGVRLTYLPVIAKALALVLSEFPNFNATLDMVAEEIIQHPTVHLGVATATDAGLLAPVVRHVEALSVLEIAREMERLAKGARERSLTPEELTGSTFTVSNFGSFGTSQGSPILNPPEAAILGIGRIARRPVVTESGAVEARYTMPVALTIDHRLLDGADAGRFLARLQQLLVRPEALLLELR